MGSFLNITTLYLYMSSQISIGIDHLTVIPENHDTDTENEDED